MDRENTLHVALPAATYAKLKYMHIIRSVRISEFLTEIIENRYREELKKEVTLQEELSIDGEDISEEIEEIL